MNDKYDKIAGALLGGAIGDALGYPIEFKRNIKEREVTRFEGIGKISDDTQMTLFTANALIWRETRLNLRGIAMSPANAIYLGYLEWLETQTQKKYNDIQITWIKNIPELNVCRAPGNTCLGALSSGKKGTIDEPINDSKGCGSVMRVAPIGLYAKNPEIAGEVAAETSALTHGHPLGIIPSYVLANMINNILNYNMSIIDSLNQSIKYLKKYNRFNNKYIKEFINLINKAVKLSKMNINDIDAINQLGEGWVADEALAIALYSALKYNNSFEDAVVCAVNHDGDSDSTGAIAGNIIGTVLGLHSIPNYYLENLELKDAILELSHDLSVTIPINSFAEVNDEKWIKKYLECKIDD